MTDRWGELCEHLEKGMGIFVSDSTKDQPLKSVEHLEFLMALPGILLH